MESMNLTKTWAVLTRTALATLAAGAPAAHAAPPSWYTPLWSEELGQPVGAAPDPARWKFNLGNNGGWETFAVTPE